ncbi:MAG: phytoene/squalene synthase family protein, partial [Candidatus Hodarchaeales archaeon]
MYTTQKTIDWGLFPKNMLLKYDLMEKTLKESYTFCLDWMAEHSKSFYFASRFLPEDQRKSVAALYAICRLSDDIVDEAPEGITIDQINNELDQLKKTITKLANGYSSTNPILHAFGDTLSRHQIPVEYMHQLIEGVRMDLTKYEYYSEDELDLYMYRVASTVGLMMTHIFIKTPAERTLARAADLGK